MLKLVSREKMLEIAEEIGIQITFDNHPDNCGISFVNEDGAQDSFIHADDIFDKLFAPIFSIKEELK